MATESSTPTPRRGRPSRSILDTMRAKAWMAGLMQATQTETAYATAVVICKALKSDPGDKRFEKHARGATSPNEVTLRLLDKKFPSSRRVFDEGPGSQVSLWAALDGDFETVWECLARYDSTFELMRLAGASHEAKVERLLRRLVPIAIEADYLAWQRGIEPNRVASHFREHPESAGAIDLDGLAALVALWRISMLVGDSWLHVWYVLCGLNDQVIPRLLTPWHIAKDFARLLNELHDRNFQRFAALLPAQPKRTAMTGW